MAYIGMQHVVAAKITTETEGAAITYGAGMVIGKAISADLTWNRNDNPLYADDAIAENDNGITSGSIELGVDDLTPAAEAYVLGLTETATSSGIYDITDEATPYLGVGYVRVRRKNGATSYQGFWMHKIQFGLSNENAQTKGETIEWQTPTLTGTIMGVKIDSSLKTKYAQKEMFDTLAAAVAWLDGKAGITSTATT